MLDVEAGTMCWAKCLSYPWWPCVIVPNDKNEFSRIRKNQAQYHVQFLGSEYDVCWVTDAFITKYFGKEQFELFIENQLNSNLAPEKKKHFEMRMSSAIQLLWNQACQDAEQLFTKSNIERLTELPKPLNQSQNAFNNSSNGDSNVIPIVPKILPKRNSSKDSVTESFPDQTKENKDLTIKISKTRKRILNRTTSKESENEADTDNDSDTKDSDIKKPKLKRKSIKKPIYKESDKVEESEKEADIKEMTKKIKKKRTTKRSLSDNEEGEIETALLVLHSKRDHVLKDDIEERCFNAYMAKEMCCRLNNANSTERQDYTEYLLKAQWAALDIDLKLQYLNDDVCYVGTSKSKVSGRQIKIPSRLRGTEDIQKIKRSSTKRRSKEPTPKKLCSKFAASSSVITVKTENSELATQCESSSSPNNQNDSHRDTISGVLWNNVTIQECLTEMMRIVVSKNVPEVKNICCYCFKSLSSSESSVTCKGDCESSYHLLCAVQNKIIRSDDTNVCVNCNHKYELCCICKNSKYMKKQFLIKCSKEDCLWYFHETCVKYLTFIEGNDKCLEICPRHSCLTCSRENYKHKCNNVGPFLSCIKCPTSYHDNLVCIPAGCRIISKSKLICYRHFDNTFVLKKSQQLTRCFVCFNENATLKCCRCRAVFHPKCMSMATYTDLLRDYVCTTCKLEQPMFQGQMVWIEINKKWTPAEIIDLPTLSMEDDVDRLTKSLAVRPLQSQQYFFANSCELIPFSIGISVLKDFVKYSDPVVEMSYLRHVMYWNWRARLRPVTSEKFIFIGHSDLLNISIANYKESKQSVTKYEYTVTNIVPEHIKKQISTETSEMCTCTPSNGVCNDDGCHNFKNDVECCDSICSNGSCVNRIFAQNYLLKPIVITNSIANRGVVLNCSFSENQLLGECNGVLMQTEDVWQEMQNREQLDSVSYVFHMSGDIYLNCEHFGNEWRHLNHCCQPNAKLVCKTVSGELKLGIFALKSILSGDEITIDYRQHVALKYGFICHCQSPNCSQIIGPTAPFSNNISQLSPLCCTHNSTVRPPDNMIPDLALGRLTITPVKSQSLQATVMDTDHCLIDDQTMIGKMSCYKCGKHGELMACDRAGCRKQYHMMCIETSSRPIGHWLCPIHFCCHCNCAAIIFCDNCPTSCCKNHSKMHLSHICTADSNGHRLDEKIKNEEEIIDDGKIEETVPDCSDRVKRVERLSFEDSEIYGEEMEYGEKIAVGEEDVEMYNEDQIECEETIVDSGQEELQEFAFDDATTETLSEVIMEQCLERQEEEQQRNSEEMIERNDDEDEDSLTGQLDTISKDHLYEAFDLVPIGPVAEAPLTSNNDHVSVKSECSDMSSDDERLYTQAPGRLNESEFYDVRYEIMPCRIEDKEDTIISPNIVDD